MMTAVCRSVASPIAPPHALLIPHQALPAGDVRKPDDEKALAKLGAMIVVSDAPEPDQNPIFTGRRKPVPKTFYE